MQVWRALWQDRLMYLSELHVPFLGLLCARLGLVQPGVPPDIPPTPAVTPAHTLAHSNSKQPAAPGHAAVA